LKLNDSKKINNSIVIDDNCMLVVFKELGKQYSRLIISSHRQDRDQISCIICHYLRRVGENIKQLRYIHGS
jgi:hypothetical protein